jgi:hypothetical protein
MNNNINTNNADSGQDSYDNWLAAWNERVEEIDTNIVSWWNESWQTTSESLDELNDKLAAWWDKQTLPEQASAEWKKARADRMVMQARIEQRVTHLVEDGKVKLAKLSADLRG